jgi:predicted metal-dependent phosphoesterase TrpH
MNRAADLHLHTRHSDGTFSSAEVVERARAAGLACLSLTDHDTLSGIPEMIPLCEAAGIEFIPGCELTAHWHEKEVHVLAYGLRWQDAAFRAAIDRFKTARAKRVADMVAKLQAQGVGLQIGDVTALADSGSALGRLHVARALLNRGFIGGVDEAFQRFIGKGKPAFVPKFRLSLAEAAALIHQAGGVAIFAHPGLAGLDDQFDALLNAGLDGIEVWHSRHSAAQCARYLEFTKSRGCLATGGSDCHGTAKGEVLLGSVRLDYGYVERLKEFHARTLSKVS